MRSLSNKSQSVSVVFPDGWDPASLTSALLQVADSDGNSVLSDVAVSLYTAAVIEYQAERYTTSIRLTDAAADLEVGDDIRIVGVNGYEDHTVEGYNPSTHTIKTENHVDRNFEAGALVYRLSGSATVDLSAVDAGTTLVFTWEPTGAGDTYTELYVVESKVQVDIAGIRRDLRDLYPRAYRSLTNEEDRLANIIDIAVDGVTRDLLVRLVDISRIKDQRELTPLITAKIANLWLLNGDKESADERGFLADNYKQTIDQFCGLPTWQDNDNDGIQDSDEMESHPYEFDRRW